MAVDEGCPRCSAAVPARARLGPASGVAFGAASAERKLVTVLFADITLSTTLGERFDPERWRVLPRCDSTSNSERRLLRLGSGPPVWRAASSNFETGYFLKEVT